VRLFVIFPPGIGPFTPTLGSLGPRVSPDNFVVLVYQELIDVTEILAYRSVELCVD